MFGVVAGVMAKVSKQEEASVPTDEEWLTDLRILTMPVETNYT